jgi:hypothetical protein
MAAAGDSSWAEWVAVLGAGRACRRAANASACACAAVSLRRTMLRVVSKDVQQPDV